MKQIIFLLLIILGGSFVNPVCAQKKGRAVVCFQSDMDCIECEKILFEYLKFEKGVKDLQIDHVSNTILIEFLEKRNDAEGLSGAVEKKGFKAEEIDREKYDKLKKMVKNEAHDHAGEVHRKRD
jgi:periplasmic mercuric ion binding protein